MVTISQAKLSQCSSLHASVPQLASHTTLRHSPLSMLYTYQGQRLRSVSSLRLHLLPMPHSIYQQRPRIIEILRQGERRGTNRSCWIIGTICEQQPLRLYQIFLREPIVLNDLLTRLQGEVWRQAAEYAIGGYIRHVWSCGEEVPG